MSQVVAGLALLAFSVFTFGTLWVFDWLEAERDASSVAGSWKVGAGLACALSLLYAAALLVGSATVVGAWLAWLVALLLLGVGVAMVVVRSRAGR